MPIPPSPSRRLAPSGKLPPSRKLRWVVLLFVGLIGGAVGGGYFLDESAPDVSDLAPPVTVVGEVDPFTWFESDTPVKPGELLATARSAGFPADSHHVTWEQRELWESDARIAEVRLRLREWFATFEAEFSRSGGDPNRIPRGPFLRPGLKVLVPVNSDDKSVLIEVDHPDWRSLSDPFSIYQILLDASRIERMLGDWDQAFVYLNMALRIETWTLIYGDDPEFKGIETVLQTLHELIDSGDLAGVKKEAVLDGLMAWELPTKVFEAASARFFQERAVELESDAFWNSGVQGSPSSARFKKNRTKRRLADNIREVRANLFTPGIVGDADTSPLVKLWIDPYGDTILQPELDYLYWLHRESFIGIWQRGQMIRIAVATHRYERAHGSPPRALEDLVPDFLPQIPFFPWAKTQPKFNAGTRELWFENERKSLELRVPPINE